MSWQGQISTMIRHLVNDLDSTDYKYSNSRIETAILVGAQLVTYEASLVTTYDINVEQCSLSPDPTDAETKDNAFINLVSLKTAALIIGSEVRTEASNAVSIKDGSSSIDLRGVASTLLALYTRLVEEYTKSLMDYQMGGNMAGQAVLGPYSPGSEFISRMSNDHRGGYFRY